MSVATSSSDSDGGSTESPVLGVSQLVTSFLLSVNQSSSLPSINSNSNAATSCSCTSSHSLLCPVSLSNVRVVLPPFVLYELQIRLNMGILV